MNKYPIEVLPEDEDDGTMPKNLAALADQVVGRRIVNVEQVKEFAEEDDGWAWGKGNPTLAITLDTGKTVYLRDTNDCCAFTELETFLFNADKIDHAIMGVGTENGYQTWHIYADMGDVLSLQVGWRCGNPFYYAFGFNILVSESPDTPAKEIM